jgi:hypothetical protein
MIEALINIRNPLLLIVIMDRNPGLEEWQNGGNDAIVTSYWMVWREK